jgi:glycosyltransferase involved in cell wall biosynthesis
MTPRLSREFGYPLWCGLPERALRARLRQQAELYRRAAVACPITRFVADAIEHDFGVLPERVQVVGIGRNHEPEAPERDWSRPRFLFVGGEWERKRGAAVVESFRDVRERHPQATLDLVSAHPPDVGGDGVRAHGSITGARVTQLFSQATCFVMPSRAEPVGIVYVEAGAAGTPSIGTTVGGAPELIGPGGVVVDPADREALTAAMLELAEPETARRLGALAYEHSRWFTWRATAERILEALQLRVRTPAGEAS